MKITKSFLKKRRACEGAIEAFEERFPKGASLAEVVEACKADGKEEYAAWLMAQPETYKEAFRLGADIHADDDAALCWASQNGHLEVVKFLVSKGANIHAVDDRALQLASQYGHLAVVKFLVSKGANIHSDDDFALQVACENGHLAVVKALEAHIKKENKK